MAKTINMITTILAAALGGALCVGSIWLHKERNKPAPEQVDIAAVVAATMQQYQPANNLTQPDLIQVPCSADYIAVHGDLLCRELFCSMTTRGVESKTSGGECEQIRNVANKKQIIALCEKQPEPKVCIELFDRRL
jgi:hypothetical protein